MTAFLGGFAQLFVPSHLLAVAALGLMAGQNAKRFPWIVLATYAFGVAVGSIMIAAALREQNAVLVLLTIAGLAGIFVAAELSIPLVVKMAAAAAGGTIAFNSPPQEITISAAIVAQTGTALAALVTFVLVMAVARYATLPWQRIGVRIIGSWIAASAILVLALRLAR